jgi:superfamily I DNA/RNA helicase
VVIKRSLDALAARPLVTIGTIHSVKGGEADTVYLFNDLSRAGTEEWCDDGSEGHDSIVRQVYVAMTRSRDRLVIANNRRGVMQIR